MNNEWKRRWKVVKTKSQENDFKVLSWADDPGITLAPIYNTWVTLSPSWLQSYYRRFPTTTTTTTTTTSTTVTTTESVSQNIGWYYEDDLGTTMVTGF